jgi:sulfur-oxidizing protein SoxZ
MADAIGSPKLRGPKKTAAGSTAIFKSLIKHPMETGLRKDKATGETIPAHFINEVTVEYNGKMVMKSAWSGAVSKNPFFAFPVKAVVTGPVKVTWKDNKGGVFSVEAPLTVG